MTRIIDFHPWLYGAMGNLPNKQLERAQHFEGQHMRFGDFREDLAGDFFLAGDSRRCKTRGGPRSAGDALVLASGTTTLDCAYRSAPRLDCLTQIPGAILALETFVVPPHPCEALLHGPKVRLQVTLDENPGLGLRPSKYQLDTWPTTNGCHRGS